MHNESLKAFALALLIFHQGCYKPEPCRKEIRREAFSPDRHNEVVVFQRICPADRSLSTHISITEAGQKLPDGNGNIFAINSDVELRVAWISDDYLKVYSYENLDGATKRTKIGKIKVEYSRIVETDLVPPIDTSPGSGK
ncbi:MAG: hypothetical protein JO076_12650 [Verrucomicrobia bacterium]|nr:hypothetical protein [Verrucomicrobiota bacterium]